MLKLATMLWSIAGTVFAGMAIMVILAVPALASHAMTYIPYAAVAGFLFAIPVALIIARQLAKPTAH